MKNLIKGLTTISFIFVLSMMFGVANVNALTTEDGLYDYTINEDGNTVTINKYNGTDTEVIIPSIIDGKSVTVIGNVAFYMLGLTGVTIPNSVTAIEAAAFAENKLTSVAIPNNKYNNSK